MSTNNQAALTGTMIRQARKNKGMTQQELADKAGTTKAMIEKIENDPGEAKVAELYQVIEQGLNGRFKIEIKL